MTDEEYYQKFKEMEKLVGELEVASADEDWRKPNFVELSKIDDILVLNCLYKKPDYLTKNKS